ncbi:MAG: DUF503 domain-containing protein [Acidimicrobiales bacterium]
MQVVAVRFELLVRGASSLKEKRARIRPILDRIRDRHHLSVSEVDHQDDWDRSTIAVAVVAPTERRALELLTSAERVVWAADVEVLDSARTWLDLTDDR